MKPFTPNAAFTLSNMGGIEIELNNTGEAVRYRLYDNAPSRRACQIQYTATGRAFFRTRSGRYYLDKFTKI